MKLTLLEGEFSDTPVYECNFCQKMFPIPSAQQRFYSDFSEEMYCTFCLRNGFDTKGNRHVLGLSFRSIFGHYYHVFYKNKRKMWFSEIDDYIHSHIEIGLQNPLFLYDSESYLWFVDFLKVGQGKRKIPVEEVLTTIDNILNCFNLSEKIPGIQMAVLFEKYKDAILKFHTQRKRPSDRRLLVPTLTGCGEPHQANPPDTRSFCPKKFILRS